MFPLILFKGGGESYILFIWNNFVFLILCNFPFNKLFMLKFEFVFNFILKSQELSKFIRLIYSLISM